MGADNSKNQGFGMSEFVEYLKDVFVHFGPIRVRRMFGGYGIFHEGVMFGLVADELLYLKADASSASHFETRGLAQFEYDKGKKIVKMSYYRAPDEIFDNPQKASIWAHRAWEAALRSKLKTK